MVLLTKYLNYFDFPDDMNTIQLQYFFISPDGDLNDSELKKIENLTDRVRTARKAHEKKHPDIAIAVNLESSGETLGAYKVAFSYQEDTISARQLRKLREAADDFQTIAKRASSRNNLTLDYSF